MSFRGQGGMSYGMMGHGGMSYGRMGHGGMSYGRMGHGGMNYGGMNHNIRNRVQHPIPYAGQYIYSYPYTPCPCYYDETDNECAQRRFYNGCPF